MPYTLLIGEYAYSDHSFRGWLELDAFDIPFKPNYVPLFSEEFTEKMSAHAPAKSLPILLDETSRTGVLSWEPAATLEILVGRHPHAGHWPDDQEMSAHARALTARARTDFQALQNLPMNLHARYARYVPTKSEEEDADAFPELLGWALDTSGGPYLFGSAFSAADAAVAPIATRLVTYGFTIHNTAKSYIETLYAHPSFRRWHACADAQLRKIECWHKDLPSGSNKAWPRHSVLPAQPHSGEISDAINAFCPYSGLPVDIDSLAEINGVVIGFCNPFCCRRGMADAQSWPTVMAILDKA
ncbi:MAG: glutathione S-transferase C-terminal domain-containing protein [Pseudomonadota bacterium]